MHTTTLPATLSNKLNLLRKIKKYLGHHHRVLYYNAYILPSIDYCLTIYGKASKSHLDRIFKLQICAAQIILDAPPDAPSKPLFVKLNWLNVFERCTLNKGVLLFKIFHNLAPNYLQCLFSHTTNNNYQLRSIADHDLAIPRHNTEFFKRSLQYSGVSMWNELPISIRNSSSLHTFKASLWQAHWLNLILIYYIIKLSPDVTFTMLFMYMFMMKWLVYLFVADFTKASW